jgi:hypothetical protein
MNQMADIQKSKQALDSRGFQYSYPEGGQSASKSFDSITSISKSTSSQTIGGSAPSKTTITDATPDATENPLDVIRRDIKQLQNAFYKNNFSTSQDFNKYSRFNTRFKVPVYATAPSVCEQGEVYVNSSAGKIYVCSSANTWSLIGTQT